MQQQQKFGSFQIDAGRLELDEASDESLSSIGDVSGSVRFSTNDQKNDEGSLSHSEQASDYMDLADELPEDDVEVKDQQAPPIDSNHAGS